MKTTLGFAAAGAARSSARAAARRSRGMGRVLGGEIGLLYPPRGRVGEQKLGRRAGRCRERPDTFFVRFPMAARVRGGFNSTHPADTHRLNVGRLSPTTTSRRPTGRRDPSPAGAPV